MGRDRVGGKTRPIDNQHLVALAGQEHRGRRTGAARAHHDRVVLVLVHVDGDAMPGRDYVIARSCQIPADADGPFVPGSGEIVPERERRGGARDDTPSLTKMFWMCLRTVWSLITRRRRSRDCSCRWRARAGSGARASSARRHPDRLGRSRARRPAELRARPQRLERVPCRLQLHGAVSGSLSAAHARPTRRRVRAISCGTPSSCHARQAWRSAPRAARALPSARSTAPRA